MFGLCLLNALQMLLTSWFFSRDQTSRVLNSTHRYVKFVRKLRAEEEEQRRGAENKAKEAKDNNIGEFFQKCDRRCSNAILFFIHNERC